ncbi:hypothetical protein [Tenacibaculum mesophilum]|uniref:hypothetical protein n=1 Tax=Tenacibaculum mesophilum TaxID=104268 RepID=UPI000B1F5DD0|nr:hypothetical protein [Tenacibaculum mesophilum]
MEKAKTWFNNTWAKTKEFMTKEYYGIPVWGYVSGVIVIGVVAYVLIPKKRWK